MSDFLFESLHIILLLLLFWPLKIILLEPLDIQGCISVHNLYDMYTAGPIMIDVLGNKVALLFWLIHSLFMVGFNLLIVYYTSLSPVSFCLSNSFYFQGTISSSIKLLFLSLIHIGFLSSDSRAWLLFQTILGISAAYVPTETSR